MSGSVTALPKRYRRPRQVRGKEIWAQDEPPPEMVWEICPYLRSHLDENRCQQCPPVEEDATYGPMVRGCFGLAAEVCRIVFAVQKRLTAASKAKP